MRHRPIAALPDETLRERAFTHLGLLTALSLKTLPYSLNPLASLERLLDLLRDVANASRGIDALAAVLRYFFVVTNADPIPVSALLATQLNEATTEAVMTTAAERWIEQGRVTGETTGRVAVLVKLLTLKFGPLTTEHLEQLQHSSIETLDHYADRILTATSVDDVFGK